MPNLQNLAAWAPVLGIAGNMDQHLNMLCLEQAGVGVRLRVGQLTPEGLQAVTGRLLNADLPYRQAAKRFGSLVQTWDTGQTFRDCLSRSAKITQ